MSLVQAIYRLCTRTPQRLFALAFVLSAVLLAAAHAFEHFGGLAPCLLCLDQREVHWIGAGLALFFILLGFLGDRMAVKYHGWLIYGLLLLALVYFYGAGLAFYHAGVEWKFWEGPAACAAGRTGIIGGALSLDMQDVHIGPSCDEAAWRLLGFSMAGWNGLISLGMAGILGLGVWRFGLRKKMPKPIAAL